MTRILFVCHGNICRSPMAEFILKDMAKKEGIENELFIASCATSTEELGNPVYPPAQRELKKHNISCEGKFSVQLRYDDYEKYDLIIAMDSYNIRNIKRIIPEDPDGKIKKLMDYTERGGDVADPWYTGNFDNTYREIYYACGELIKTIK